MFLSATKLYSYILSYNLNPFEHFGFEVLILGEGINGCLLTAYVFCARKFYFRYKLYIRNAKSRATVPREIATRQFIYFSFRESHLHSFRWPTASSRGFLLRSSSPLRRPSDRRLLSWIPASSVLSGQT